MQPNPVTISSDDLSDWGPDGKAAQHNSSDRTKTIKTRAELNLARARWTQEGVPQQIQDAVASHTAVAGTLTFGFLQTATRAEILDRRRQTAVALAKDRAAARARLIAIQRQQALEVSAIAKLERANSFFDRETEEAQGFSGFSSDSDDGSPAASARPSTAFTAAPVIYTTQPPPELTHQGQELAQPRKPKRFSFFGRKKASSNQPPPRD